MKIRNKILLYISSTVIVSIAIAFVFIYILFSGYREEEFQQKQNNKIKTTIKLIEKFKDQSAEISYLLDKQDINDFYDEKVLIFDQNKQPLFSSLDNLEIGKYKTILSELSPEKQWIETTEGEYDVVGIYRKRHDVVYYGISKAYDAYGNTKLVFLRNTLIVIFFLIALVIVFISIYIARTIARPISELESKINNYKLDKENNIEISIDTSTIELNNLTERFNELLMHTNEVLRFQKHTINHISHQLKTPIAVLVSELEKIQTLAKDTEISQLINQQKIKAQSLGNIINVLLEISKIDSGQEVDNQNKRVDELVFDCINELNIIYPDFNFNITYSPSEMEEANLMVNMNPTLLKQAFSNLLSNCVTYSANNQADIQFIAQPNEALKIQFKNTGNTITEEENKFLFKYFFRGKNSDGKTGHGLGLMLTRKIVELHNASISYQRKKDLNLFEVVFPTHEDKNGFRG